jgi:hypothetical protein
MVVAKSVDSLLILRQCLTRKAQSERIFAEAIKEFAFFAFSRNSR